MNRGFLRCFSWIPTRKLKGSTCSAADVQATERVEGVVWIGRI